MAAIVRDIVFFFYNPKDLDYIGVLSFFRSVHAFSAFSRQWEVKLE